MKSPIKFFPISLYFILNSLPTYTDFKINPLSSPNMRNCVVISSYKLNFLLFPHINIPHLPFSVLGYAKQMHFQRDTKKKSCRWLIWINQIKTKHKSISGSNTLCWEREWERDRERGEKANIKWKRVQCSWQCSHFAVL